MSDIEKLADAVWQLDIRTIGSLHAKSEDERGEIETVLSTKYDATIDLDGTPDEIQAQLNEVKSG
jgi:hypothetical protein